MNESEARDKIRQLEQEAEELLSSPAGQSDCAKDYRAKLIVAKQRELDDIRKSLESELWSREFRLSQSMPRTAVPRNENLVTVTPESQRNDRQEVSMALAQATIGDMLAELDKRGLVVAMSVSGGKDHETYCSDACVSRHPCRVAMLFCEGIRRCLEGVEDGQAASLALLIGDVKEQLGELVNVRCNVPNGRDTALTASPLDNAEERARRSDQLVKEAHIKAIISSTRDFPRTNKE
jgi:hypothetical protein